MPDYRGFGGSVLSVLVFVASVALSFVAPSYIANRFKVFYDVNFGELTPEQRYGEAYHSLQNLEAVRVGGLLGQGGLGMWHKVRI